MSWTCAAFALMLGGVWADSRPLLVSRPNSATEKQHLALRQLRDATKAVSDAAREAEAARQRLQGARDKAREAREELARQRAIEAATMRCPVAEAMVSEHARALRNGRTYVLGCLLSFTFLNGLARRSLSSAGPSMVAEGLLSVDRANEIFMVGFDAFCIGKLLVLPSTILLGVHSSLLLQLAMMALACVAYLVAPAAPAVQIGAWVTFRIFSAMAVSTMLPFVGAWFPRRMYGRIFACLFCGFQLGYLTCSYYWQWLLFAGRLHWRLPFAQCAAGFAALFVACKLGLKEKPPEPPTPTMLRNNARKAEEQQAGKQAGKQTGKQAERAALETGRDRSSATDATAANAPLASTPAASAAGTGVPAAAAAIEVRSARRLAFGALLHKVATRWVFWAMLVACVGYSPAVEYSTHVTSYLKEMFSSGTQASPSGFVCLQSTLCEGRYRAYVFSYVSALLLGSVLYDRASQLDRAFLVIGLFGTVRRSRSHAASQPNTHAGAVPGHGRSPRARVQSPSTGAVPEHGRKRRARTKAPSTGVPLRVCLSPAQTARPPRHRAPLALTALCALPACPGAQNVACWAMLALAEPNAPAAAWVKGTASSYSRMRALLGWRR